VISEALMAGLPVIASDIEGSRGLLGADYPGYYPVQDTDALRDRLLRAESDSGYYSELQAACASLRERFMPQKEESGWNALLQEIRASAG